MGDSYESLPHVAANDNQPYCIYSLADSREPDRIRYVGMTINAQRRLVQHRASWRRNVQSHNINWIRSVKEDGGDIVMSILHDGLTESKAKVKEVEEIARFRSLGCKLTNGTAGGDGCAEPTPEVRKRMSQSAKAARTPAVRAKISASVKALMTAENLERMSAATKTQMTPEMRAHLSIASSGWSHTPEAKAKIADASRKRIVSDETRKKIGDIHRGRVNSAETRARMSEAQKGKPLPTEQTRAKMRENTAARRPEVRAKNSDAQVSAAPRKNEYKGAFFHKQTGRWTSGVSVGGKSRYLGIFDTAKEAAVAYDKAAFETWGSNCYLNFGHPAELDA